jgi:transposase
MDVSEKKITIYTLPEGAENGTIGDIPNRAEAVSVFIKELRRQSHKEITVVMEAGTHSAWLSKLAHELGCKTYVGHSRKIKAIWGDDRKCDGKDAEMLARLAKADPKLLSPIRHCSEGARTDLVMIKSRDALVRTRTSLINHVRGQLRTFGVKGDDEIGAESFAKKVKELIPRELKVCLDIIVRTIAEINAKIKVYDRQIEKLCAKHKETSHMTQIRGVGPLTALTFALVIENPARFRDGRRVGAYVGLTPKRDQSGDSDKQCGISGAGNGLLRRYLVQAAHYILGPLGEDCDLRRFGQRIAARGGKGARKKATAAVARKLAGLLRKLWLEKAEYVPLYKESLKKSA